MDELQNLKSVGKAKKFGAFGGVYVPSLLSILGVIMFLRLPWIVGVAGLWSTLGIILVAHVISITTGLSISSLATDKRVETGGAYFIISRSLGLPIGGTLGLALFVGFSFSISLYLIGFAETFLSYFGFEKSLYTIRITGSIILLLVTIVTFISTSLAIRVQYLILAILALSLVSVFFGSHGLQPVEPIFGPLEGSLPWIVLFAIFFPAVTGFNTGVSMSGDLRNPHKAIPAGTIMAILTGLVIYAGLAVFLSYTVDRSLLANDPNVLFAISWIPQLVVAGIFAATLSSALGSIMGAPRILKAVAIDRILPGFFSRGYGSADEPRNALIVTYLIAQTGILIGELNVIARIVTIFFIITYGFLNITYVAESWASSDFRPTFRIPRFVGIIGALASIVVMIQLDVLALVVASVLLILLFLYLKRKELSLQSGDTWTGIWSSLVKTGLGRLSKSTRMARTWRPNVMLFSGGEKHRPHLIEMGKSLVGKLGVFTNFELTEQPSGEILFGLKDAPGLVGEKQEKGVFTRKHTCRDIYEGIDVISRVYGFAGFEPNTILMGWGRNTRNPEKFIKLLNNLKRQDYNNLFLSYDKEKGFGTKKQIDFWWSGKGRSLSLVLYLMKFFTSGSAWRAASFRVFVVHSDSSKTDPLYSLINQLLDNHRLKADVKVINNAVEQLPLEKIIRAESRETDLCIMELPEFNSKEPQDMLKKANLLIDSVSTALLVSASTFFDDINIIDETQPPEREQGPDVIKRATFDVVSYLQPSSREIITNEVVNIAQTASKFALKYYENGPERIHRLDLRFFPELLNFTLKTIDTLQRSVSSSKRADRDKNFLVILNDFSFHTQRHIHMLREQRVQNIQQYLEEANISYLDELRAMINVMPEHIRIKLSGKEFAIKDHDRFRTRFYKTRKRLLSAILRKPVTHKIRVTPSARYFLYHKRIQLIHELMVEFALHSFMEMVEVGKLFNAIHELIEKVRLEEGNKAKSLEMIKLERSRLAAKVDVVEEDSKNFYLNAGQKMHEALLADLQEFSHTLESTGANILSSNFYPYFKKDPAIVADIEQFAKVWSKNLSLFINKAIIDYYILSIKSRIQSKIKKYNYEFKLLLNSELIRHLDEFERNVQQLLADKEAGLSKTPRLEHEHLKAIPVAHVFNGLYSEIGELLNDIPDKIEVTAEQLGEKFKETAFTEAERLMVSLRKTVEYYVSTELIDFSNKKCIDIEQELKQHLASVKDMVRLLNFSLDNRGKDDAAAEQADRDRQALVLIQSFLDKLVLERQQILHLAANIENAFAAGLKQSFDPLSSATINKTSLAVRRRSRDAEQAELSGSLQRQWQRLREIARNRFVDLLYSKSEGQLWISHFEQPDAKLNNSNRDVLTFAETITPDPAIIKELPFYYTSLFSGQSGTGDDFWIGMDAEIQASVQAVQRYKAGFPGALLITGARTSGKSSLSKKVAERFFSMEHIHSVQAPQDCSADADLFVLKLLDALNARNRRVEDVFRAMPAGKVIIIHDLGLWWERRPGGNVVVETILNLIDRFGNKCLFIINVNAYAFNLIDKQTKLSSYALATVQCEPFDARELKEMIMLRHQAGGLKFQIHKKEESRMSAWDFARLFNRLFDQSKGNPGLAARLWLSSIKKVSGKTIVLDTVKLPDKNVFEVLTPIQWFYIQQFLYNRRFTVAKLAKNIERTEADVAGDVRELMRTGILVERFEGVFAIRSGLDLYLAEQLKNKKRL